MQLSTGAGAKPDVLSIGMAAATFAAEVDLDLRPGKHIERATSYCHEMDRVSPHRPMELFIVEDNAGDVRLLEEAFRELKANVNIRVAKDGAEGIEMLVGPSAPTNWRPDLILLDLNLPKLSGHDVLARIKADPRTRRIPVIILTSSRAETDVKRAYEAHANAYLRKPSTLSGLMDAAQDVKGFWLETATLPG